MLSLQDFKKLNVGDKLEQIYISFTNHLSEHKIIDGLVIGVSVGVFLLVLNVAIGIIF